MFCADSCSCKGNFQGLRVTEGIFEGSIFNINPIYIECMTLNEEDERMQNCVKTEQR